MIVLTPSRNISHVSEHLTLFESSDLALDAVVTWLLLSFDVECCLNQTIERSRSLKNRIYKELFLLSSWKFT